MDQQQTPWTPPPDQPAPWINPAAPQHEEQRALWTPPHVMLQEQLQHMQLQVQQEQMAQVVALQVVQRHHLRLLKQEFDNQQDRLQRLHQVLLEQMQSPLRHLEHYMHHLQQQLEKQLQQNLEQLRLSYSQMQQEVQQHVHCIQQQLLQEARHQLQGLKEQQARQQQVQHHQV